MKVLALDRDGVINFDSDNYILNQKNWHPIPGSLEAIKKAKSHGFVIAVVSNQSALGRKMLDTNSFHQINKKFFVKLKQCGGQIDLYLVCPHTPEQNCNCRKPRSGLFETIADLLGIDITKLIFIGDKMTDVYAAENIGAKSILVETGKVLDNAAKNYTRFRNLTRAIDYVIKNYENF
jgi:D-glycero-D-manno-heptose 1,7-bisphosphate phosphatase